ncbi:MAG TPA: DNA double-strand break repair nuclease NurA [archaeon]|nr:DNA double-strand break repair nuclease NurA [archaeon]
MSESKKGILERVPQTFREQYFSLFAGPEPETIHADLYQNLIDEGTDLIIEHLKAYNVKRKEIMKKCMELVKIKEAKCDEKLANTRIIASDAGNNGVDFRSAFAPLYAATAIVSEGWDIFDEPVCKAGKPDLWADEFKPEGREALLSAKTQFDVTRHAITKWKPKYAVIDGTILLNIKLMPDTNPGVAYLKDYDETLESAVRLIHSCWKSNVPLVGFVKRTRLNQISRKLGVEKIRDTALLDLILRGGQYTEPIDVMGGNVVDAYKKKSIELKMDSDFIDNCLNIYSVYIRTGLTTPFRLELPKYSLNQLPEICSIIYTTCEEDGIPYAIREVDGMTKITTTLSNIRTLMLFSKAFDLVKKGEMEPEDLNLLALQYGETFGLCDEVGMSALPGGK